jgi:hypothetical protein
MYNATLLIRDNTNTSKFVVTPSTVRLWDSTWDCLVSPRFLNKPLGYERTNNPYDDVVSNDTEYTVSEVKNVIIGQPYMKFAGGWFTIISKDLLTTVPIPDSFSHYGLEDTYIMWAVQLLNDPDIRQFKVNELVVCENYFDRDASLNKNISLIDRREEYKQHNTNMFNIELQKLLFNTVK